MATGRWVAPDQLHWRTPAAYVNAALRYLYCYLAAIEWLFSFITSKNGYDPSHPLPRYQVLALGQVPDLAGVAQGGGQDHLYPVLLTDQHFLEV